MKNFSQKQTEALPQHSVLKRKFAAPANRFGWTRARRQAQAERMRQARLWLRSTGPRTPEGKARVAQNSANPQRRAKKAALVLIRRGLRAQGLYLTIVKHYIRAKAHGHDFIPPIDMDLLDRQISDDLTRGLALLDFN